MTSRTIDFIKYFNADVFKCFFPERLEKSIVKTFAKLSGKKHKNQHSDCNFVKKNSIDKFLLEIPFKSFKRALLENICECPFLSSRIFFVLFKNLFSTLLRL